MSRAQSGAARARLVQAAAAVVERCGAAKLTLDRVAAEASVSKGGLLYHFPSKQALLEGMVEDLLARSQARLVDGQKIFGGDSRAAIRSFVHAEANQSPVERSMTSALIAAAAEDPELIEPARALFAGWMRQVRAESDDGPLLMLACEGIRFLSMFDLLPGGAKGQARLYRELEQAAAQGLS